MPVLHQMQVSGNCYKIRLAARQLGVELTLKNYGLHDGTTRQPTFLSKNPNGRVPLLEFEDGRRLAAKGNAALGVMQNHLARHDWFAGGRYSIADIALYGYTHCAADGGFDLADYPAVGTWIKRVAGEPGHVPLGLAW